MKNIISKKDLLKKIKGKESKEEEIEEIIGTYEMPPCKPLSYIRLVQQLPKIGIDPENYPDLKINLAPGIYITGAGRVYQISEVNRNKDSVKAILLWYDKSKCMYSFTIGDTHEFKMEEFTSEFWAKYYRWRRANKDELIQCGLFLTTVTPGTVIYDSNVNGYFKFIDYISPLKLSNGKSHWILKAFLLYTEDNITKRQYRDCLKSYYTDNTITNAPVINYKEVRLVYDKEYLELVTGVRNLEIEKSENPTTPMNFLFNCLSETSTFRIEDKTYYITRLDETEVKCIEITEDFSIIHHTFNLDNLPINHR